MTTNTPARKYTANTEPARCACCGVEVPAHKGDKITAFDDAAGCLVVSVYAPGHYDAQVEKHGK